MKIILTLYLILSGSFIGWVGVSTLMTTTHGIGVAETNRLEVAIRYSAKETPQITSLLEVLRDRLYRADQQVDNRALIICETGAFQVALGLVFLIYLVVACLRARDKKPKQRLKPTPGVTPAVGAPSAAQR